MREHGSIRPLDRTSLREIELSLRAVEVALDRKDFETAELRLERVETMIAAGKRTLRDLRYLRR